MNNTFNENEIKILDSITKKHNYGEFDNRNIFDRIDEWRRIVEVIDLGFPDDIDEYCFYIFKREVLQMIIDKLPKMTGNKVQNLISAIDKKFINCTLPLAKTWLNIPNPTELDRMLFFRKPKKFGTFESLKKDFETSGL